jgi:hypothetical protein
MILWRISSISWFEFRASAKTHFALPQISSLGSPTPVHARPHQARDSSAYPACLIFFTPQGMAGFVLSYGSMSSNQSGEGDIRRSLIDADLVDCMVALPG